MEIRQLDDNKEFDVFLGTGWENWVRVRYTNSCVEVVKSSLQPSQQTLDMIYWKIKKKFFTPQRKQNDKGT